ncbi:hypothetical protein [Streptosporangium sp. NPDC003464]
MGPESGDPSGLRQAVHGGDRYSAGRARTFGRRVKRAAATVAAGTAQPARARGPWPRLRGP